MSAEVVSRSTPDNLMDRFGLQTSADGAAPHRGRSVINVPIPALGLNSIGQEVPPVPPERVERKLAAMQRHLPEAAVQSVRIFGRCQPIAKTWLQVPRAAARSPIHVQQQPLNLPLPVAYRASCRSLKNSS